MSRHRLIVRQTDGLGVEVGKGDGVGIQGLTGGCVTARPRAPCSIEDELSQRLTEVELIDMPLTHFTAEAELVLADVIGDDIGQHSGDVVAAFRRCNSDLFEARDLDIWRT